MTKDVQFSNWELGMFDDPSSLPSREELSEKEDYGKGMGGGRSDLWYPGMGTTQFYAVPFWDPTVRRGGSYGGFNTDVQWYEHDGFLAQRVPCLKTRFGVACDICELSAALYKEFFQDTQEKWKHPFFKNNGLFPSKFQAAVMILMEKDCGDKGSTKFKRADYTPGNLYVAKFMKDAWIAYIKLLKNVQWTGPNGQPIYHPRSSRLLEYTVDMKPNTDYRRHNLTALPKLSAIAESEEDIKDLLDKANNTNIWAMAWGWDATDAKELAEACKNHREKQLSFGQYEGAPDVFPKLPENTTKAIVERIPVIKEMARMNIQYSSDRARGKIEATKNGTVFGNRTDNQTISVEPTDELDSKDKPICMDKHVKSESHPLCQICPVSTECEIPF